jgi:cell shape-determining protein MreC
MLSLILLIVFGLLMAFFATQNTHLGSITLANYGFTSIPMYLIVVISMLFGVLVSWILSLVSTVSSSLTIHGKESEIKNANKTITELNKKVHALELENAKLAGEHGVETHTEEVVESPSVLQRIKHSFS